MLMVQPQLCTWTHLPDATLTSSHLYVLSEHDARLKVPATSTRTTAAPPGPLSRITLKGATRRIVGNRGIKSRCCPVDAAGTPPIDSKTTISIC